MRQDTKTDLIKYITTLDTIADLNTVRSILNDRRDTLGRQTKYELVVGDKVTVNNGRSIDEGTITKINRTRAVVNMRDSSWTVPFSMIRRKKDD